jgi:hypothetical protein
MAVTANNALLERVRHSLVTSRQILHDAQQISVRTETVREMTLLSIERIQGCILLSQVEKEGGFQRLYLYR